MNLFIKNILQTLRPLTSSIAGLTVCIMLFNSNQVSIVKCILFGINFLFITMYGFVINDILDYQKDKIAKRNKPIAKDEISLKSAINFSFILISIVFALEYLIGNSDSNKIILFTAGLLTLYSIFSLKAPILKGIITGVLSITPILYVGAIIGSDFNQIAYFIVLLYIFGRELYMDAQDYNGDRLSKLKTIPYYLGVSNSKFIGFSIMLLASVVLLTYNLYSHNALLILLSLMAFIVMVLSIFISLKDEDKGISLTKISMLLAIIPLFHMAI